MKEQLGRRVMETAEDSVRRLGAQALCRVAVGMALNPSVPDYLISGWGPGGGGNEDNRNSWHSWSPGCSTLRGSDSFNPHLKLIKGYTGKNPRLRKVKSFAPDHTASELYN